MDIDYVMKPKTFKTPDNSMQRKEKYCYIYEMKGHITDRCGFNPKVREERRRNQFKSTTENGTTKKNILETLKPMT